MKFSAVIAAMKKQKDRHIQLAENSYTGTKDQHLSCLQCHFISYIASQTLIFQCPPGAFLTGETINSACRFLAKPGDWNCISCWHGLMVSPLNSQYHLHQAKNTIQSSRNMIEGGTVSRYNSWTNMLGSPTRTR
jgi:hypothetical protein